MGQCFITRKGGSSKITEKTLEALGFINVPKGEWVLKKGTLSTSSLNGSTYIPLVAYVSCDYTNWNDSYATTAIKDNSGTNYGSTGVGGANSEANPRLTMELHMDLTLTNSFNCTKLLAIRSFTGVQSSSIKSWLEKVS